MSDTPTPTPNTGNTNKVLVQPLKSALIAGHPQRVQVLVRVQAPDADPTRVKTRPPYALALVIDHSGSMSGEPLHEAKRCAGHIVDQLRPDDRAALVQFDNQVHILVPPGPVGNRHALHQALESIQEGGMTNLHGGWQAGAKGLLEQVQAAGLCRVILLSDGNANEGLTDPQTIADQCKELAGAGVSTSTYGLGHQFNEELMVAMAQAGQGNHYYGATAQDLFEPFAEEFDLLSSLYARQLRLSFGSNQAVKSRLLNDYPVEDLRGFPVVRLPDLAWGSEAWAMVELEVPAPAAGTDVHTLLQVELTGSDLDGQPIVFPEAVLRQPAIPAQAWEALLPDPLVLQRWNEVQAGHMLQEARAAVRRGDWATVERLLAEAQARFADSPWVQQVLQSLQELAKRRDLEGLSKEAMYSSRRMNSRLSGKEEQTHLAAESYAPSFLRRKQAQGKAQFRHGPEDDKDTSQK